MQKTARLVIVGVTLVTLMVLALTASALAASVSTTQSAPGITQRTIWDQTQVSIRKLPFGVNHTGPIHMELTFKPTTTADLDIYLLNAQGDALNVEQGCMGIFAGKEYIDFYVDDVVNQDIVPSPYDGSSDFYMVGDTYYLVIVAFNGSASYQIWGYYPQIWLDDSEDPYASYNYYLQSYRYPAKATTWATITGPRYGGQYDFRPTSEGVGTLALQWPADIVNKVVTYDRATKPMPFNVEQYLFAGTYWEEVLANWGTEENYYPDDQGGWYGLLDDFEVTSGDVPAPQQLQHYVPSLFLAYKDALLGPDGEVKYNARTPMGFKAVLTWPENLWLRKVTKYSTYYLVSGRYSLDGAAVPVGTKIEIQRKTATKGWATVKTVKTTNSVGAWSVKLSPGVKWWVRAKAVGNDSTGLPTEYSITKVLAAL